MIAFWVVAGVLAAAAAGLVLFRAAGAAHETTVDPTPLVYRRQLAEIDELAERGLIGETERKSAHAEAARRLLAAADAPKAACAWGVTSPSPCATSAWPSSSQRSARSGASLTA